MPALAFYDVNISYGPKTVLRDFNLVLEPREKVALTGTSGAGKSTVIQLGMGLVAPQSGKIVLDDTELSEKNVWDMRKKIAYVPQEPELGQGTVEEVLSAPFCFHANRHLAFRKEDVEKLFAGFKLDMQLYEQDISGLSGGEKQRIALVQALLLEREVYLLDEPASALDAESKRAVNSYFSSREDVTVLAVSHDAEGVAFCTRSVEVPYRPQETAL